MNFKIQDHLSYAEELLARRVVSIPALQIEEDDQSDREGEISSIDGDYIDDVDDVPEDDEPYFTDDGDLTSAVYDIYGSDEDEDDEEDDAYEDDCEEDLSEDC